MGGRMDAAYYREYRRRIKADPARAAHYRTVDNARQRRLRAIPGWRAEHEPRPSRATVLPDVPARHVGHDLFDRAFDIVPRRTSGLVAVVSRDDELADDLRSEAVLALLEGRDAADAVRTYRSRERAWISRSGFLGSQITGEWSEAA
jgi:hypothetical protein